MSYSSSLVFQSDGRCSHQPRLINRQHSLPRSFGLSPPNAPKTSAAFINGGAILHLNTEFRLSNRERSPQIREQRARTEIKARVEYEMKEAANAGAGGLEMGGELTTLAR